MNVKSFERAQWWVPVAGTWQYPTIRQLCNNNSTWRKRREFFSSYNSNTTRFYFKITCVCPSLL